jgi:hypothetical protein
MQRENAGEENADRGGRFARRAASVVGWLYVLDSH